MNIPYYHVDAFTRKTFSGNPAGVCLLDTWLDDRLLQKIAAENNLPETAYIVKDGEVFQLRWFTPEQEIDLCGHATLASAFILNLTRTNDPQPYQFETKSGRLTVHKHGDVFAMDFPSRPAEPCHVPPELIKGLGADPNAVLKARDYLAVFTTEEEIKALNPDFAVLALLDCLGIIVTAPGHTVDFVSRFFAPGAGIPEDPVTGSSHCTLIPYWAEQTGKEALIARQVSKRGGELFCENKDDRVIIGGQAFLYSVGTLTI